MAAAGRPAPGRCSPSRLANHVQTDREQIWKLVENGENLLSRFRHWEPIIRELHAGRKLVWHNTCVMQLSLRGCTMPVHACCRPRDAWWHSLLHQPLATTEREYCTPTPCVAGRHQTSKPGVLPGACQCILPQLLLLLLLLSLLLRSWAFWLTTATWTRSRRVTTCNLLGQYIPRASLRRWQLLLELKVLGGLTASTAAAAAVALPTPSLTARWRAAHGQLVSAVLSTGLDRAHSAFCFMRHSTRAGWQNLKLIHWVSKVELGFTRML